MTHFTSSWSVTYRRWLTHGLSGSPEPHPAVWWPYSLICHLVAAEPLEMARKSLCTPQVAFLAGKERCSPGELWLSHLLLQEMITACPQKVDISWVSSAFLMAQKLRGEGKSVRLCVSLGSQQLPINTEISLKYHLLPSFLSLCRFFPFSSLTGLSFPNSQSDPVSTEHMKMAFKGN